MILGAALGSVVGYLLSRAYGRRTPEEEALAWDANDALAWTIVGAMAGLLIAAAL